MHLGLYIRVTCIRTNRPGNAVGAGLRNVAGISGPEKAKFVRLQFFIEIYYSSIDSHLDNIIFKNNPKKLN